MFRFRLEKVLQVRDIVEEQKKQEWMMRRQELLQQTAHLEEMQVQKKAVLEFGHSSDDLQIRTAMYRYLSTLDRKINNQKDTVNQCTKRTNVAKSEWISSRQDKEVVEKLRAKKFENYQKEQERAAQKVLDDIGSQIKTSY